MPLVDARPPPSPLNMRPLFTVVAAVIGSALFVVGLGVVARLTADTAPPYARMRALDGVREARGPDVGVDEAVDAGALAAGDAAPFVDAGALVTVSLPASDEQDVDAGPPTAARAPFAPAAVITSVVAIVEGCAADALRWDPSLGGPFVIVVDLGPLFSAPDGVASPQITTPGLVSPVLASCLVRHASEAALPPLGDVDVALAVRARAILAADGRVTWSDPAVTTSSEPGGRAADALDGDRQGEQDDAERPTRADGPADGAPDGIRVNSSRRRE